MNFGGKISGFQVSGLFLDDCGFVVLCRGNPKSRDPDPDSWRSSRELVLRLDFSICNFDEHVVRIQSMLT